MGDTTLTVLRLDGGDWDDSGDFRCTREGCLWKENGVKKYAATVHVQRDHPGFRARIVRTEEAKAAFEHRKVGVHPKSCTCWGDERGSVVPRSCCVLVLIDSSGVCDNQMDAPLTVLRLDDAAWDEPGDFRCTADDCSWEASGVKKGALTMHVQRHHPGFHARIVRTEEGKAAYKRKAAQRKVGPYPIPRV